MGVVDVFDVLVLEFKTQPSVGVVDVFNVLASEPKCGLLLVLWVFLTRVGVLALW